MLTAKQSHLGVAREAIGEILILVKNFYKETYPDGFEELLELQSDKECDAERLALFSLSKQIRSRLDRITSPE